MLSRRLPCRVVTLVLGATLTLGLVASPAQADREPKTDWEPQTDWVTTQVAEGDWQNLPRELWGEILDRVPGAMERACLTLTTCWLHKLIGNVEPPVVPGYWWGSPYPLHIVSDQATLEKLLADSSQPELHIQPGKGSALVANRPLADGGTVVLYGPEPLAQVSAGKVVTRENAVIISVTGGEVVAVANTTVTDVSGGIVGAWDTAQVIGVTGGTIHAWGDTTVTGVTGGSIVAEDQVRIEAEDQVTITGRDGAPVPDTVTITGPDGDPVPSSVTILGR